MLRIRDLSSIFINVNSLTAKCLNHAQPYKIILKLIFNWFSVDTSLSSREFWVIMHVNSFTVISLWDTPYGKVHISCLVHVAWLFWASSLILNLHFQKMLRAPFVCELQRAAFSSPEPLLMYCFGLCCLDSSNILSAEGHKQKKNILFAKNFAKTVFEIRCPESSINLKINIFCSHF